MYGELTTAGVVAAAHGAATKQRMKVGGAAGTDFAQPRRPMRTGTAFSSHRMMSDLAVTAIADLSATFA
jgi:hypothetical protein